jgi:hypothetical protein
VKLSDVFGADQIIWVEGQTEERCYPMLLERRGKLSPSIAIVGLIAPSDLEAEGIRGQLALEIYKRLSEGNALVPPAVAICLDREDRSDQTMDDLGRASRGLIKFIPRRTYENYLLDADAIAVLLKDQLGAAAPSAQDVQNWLDGCSRTKNYFTQQGFAARTDGNWELLIDAPNVLKDLFNHFSNATLVFRKTLHSPALTSWLLKNKPNKLAELLDFVCQLLPQEQ